MKPLFNTSLLKSLDKNDIQFECYVCSSHFLVRKIEVKYALGILPIPSKSNNTGCLKYCSKKCKGVSMNTEAEYTCTHCSTKVVKKACEVRKVKNIFCSRSCAATYNNLNKKTGNRRSKLEVWLEAQLNVMYPELAIEYCNKAAINGELDIYVPSLRLAFELNGIYHYEPIHGQGKLDQVQSNDGRKFQACIEHDIELVIMDTSQLKYFKEANCLPYLHIIQKIVDMKLANVSQP